MRKTSLALFLLLSIFIITSFAGGPLFWRVASRAEIEKGDANGVAIGDNGALTLAPSFAEIFDTKQAYIWSTAADSSGNIFLGTGHEGRVFKVDSAGKGALFFKSNELDVMALAVDQSGNVYAGTAPDGKVYKINPRGESTVFFEPNAKYIWALTFDAQGRLLVGTGDKGIIYRVTPDGKGTAWVNTSQTNITALKVDGGGNVIAGTDPGGLVLRIAPDGRTSTLFDSSQKEIREIVIGRNGTIYALALSETGTAASSAVSTPSQPIVLSQDEGVTVTISDIQVIESGSTASSTSSSSSGQAKSALYRIDASGVADTIWNSPDNTAFTVTVDDNGRALVGTGQKGRIYSAVYGARPGLQIQSTEAQTSRFVRTASGQLFAASSNLGKLFRVGSGTAASGTYTSSVRDAGTVALWGKLSFVGNGDVTLQTRSGNTANPDSTWSDWSAPVREADGAPVASPGARYLQWRATLKSAGAGLREVTVSYLARNLAPAITSLTVQPVGVALQPLPQQAPDPNIEQAALDPATFSIPTNLPPRKFFLKGAISLQWTAEDRNGDKLNYSIFYRPANGTEFFPLKVGFAETYYTVDPNALPDGRYVFKVVVDDGISNPGDMALTDEQETDLVEVDNSAPMVTADSPRIGGNTVEVIFHAEDRVSIIRRGEYQIDGGAWKSIFPVDGIADSRKEDFKVTATLPDNKSHVIALRAFDSNANAGSTAVKVR